MTIERGGMLLSIATAARAIVPAVAAIAIAGHRFRKTSLAAMKPCFPMFCLIVTPPRLAGLLSVCSRAVRRERLDYSDLGPGRKHTIVPQWTPRQQSRL